MSERSEVSREGLRRHVSLFSSVLGEGLSWSDVSPVTALSLSADLGLGAEHGVALSANVLVDSVLLGQLDDSWVHECSVGTT